MKKFGHVISGFKADWNNHLIEFLGTILGILIAFQLQDWQDARKEKEKLYLAIASLKTELSENNKALKKGLEQLKYFNGYTGFIIKHLNTDSTIICSVNEWDSLKQIYKGNDDIPEWVFSESRTVKKFDKNYIEVLFTVPYKFFPPTIYTDSWQAVKSSGHLNSFPINKVTTLSRLYNELDRSHTGRTPDDFYKKADSDLNSFNKITIQIELEYQIKLWRMEESFDEIMKY